ncbi:MAG: hypothetical protein M1839_005586 [Geoglossum umbratile]|nr:MAG: hypothetical protein M1839_005586 [Geoglossum umbratile]
MGNGPLSPKQQPLESPNSSESRVAPSAGNSQVYNDLSTSGLQASTEAPAIVASPHTQQAGQGLESQTIPLSSDSQQLALGGYGSLGTLNASNAVPSPYPMAQIQAQGGPFNMGDMSRSLHEYNPLPPTGQHYGQLHQQQFPAGLASASTPTLVYQVQPEMPQLASQPAVSYHHSPIWPLNYPQQYQPIYQQSPQNTVGSGYPQLVQPHQLRPPSLNPAQSQYTNAQWLPQQRQQQQQQQQQLLPQHPTNSYTYFHAPSGISGQDALSGYGVGNHPTLPCQPPPYTRRSSFPVQQGSGSRSDSEYEGIYPRAGTAANSGFRTGNPGGRSGSVPNINSGISSNSGSNLTGVLPGPPHSSILRGPPRKPKQTGHALWVGNLPPGTSVVDLKDYFSRDATADIESVFLISKSNCAFVNYKTEAACASAMSRFHDSRFQGVRLVCRLRRGSATPPASTPIGPSSSTQALSSEHLSQPPATHIADLQGEEGDVSIADGVPKEGPERLKERYFIVKSLTVEDLDISVQNGTWATQSHNEEALDKAFESSESVYLIFSANKSGEYYGYARMASPISGESPPPTTNWVPKMRVAENLDLPRAIPTPATEYAPKGRIIDDSARGTIFWETDDEIEDLSTPKDGQDNVSEKSEDGEDGMASSKSWGKPFKIEWISTTRLPFYRTRGLRNPWNANREVKIARDGTELETSVGRRLLMMFHRSAPSSTGASVATIPILQVPTGFHQVH